MACRLRNHPVYATLTEKAKVRECIKSELQSRVTRRNWQHRIWCTWGEIDNWSSPKASVDPSLHYECDRAPVVGPEVSFLEFHGLWFCSRDVRTPLQEKQLAFSCIPHLRLFVICTPSTHTHGRRVVPNRGTRNLSNVTVVKDVSTRVWSEPTPTLTHTNNTVPAQHRSTPYRSATPCKPPARLTPRNTCVYVLARLI